MTSPQMHAVPSHQRKFVYAFSLDLNATPKGVAIDHMESIGNDFIQVQRLQFQLLFAQKRAHATDGLACALIVISNVGDDCAQFL